MIVVIPFETPSKKNSRITYTRTGRSFPNKKYVEWHRKAEMWLLSHYRNMETFGTGTAVSVKMTFVHGSLQRSDSDNKVSSILDLLVDLHIIPDDNWKIVRRIVVENTYDKGRPSCTLEVVPYSDVREPFGSPP